TSYSRVVTIYFDADKTNIQVYPNPVADGMMNVKMDKAAMIEMYNNAGILVLRKMLYAGNSVIDVRSFNKGNYILKANAEVIKVIIP
ncbi:MAG: T9SS type A sorting domain-containing protein, partial [Chitinophagaceae bacterium]